jgi:hypothetical protein
MAKIDEDFLRCKSKGQEDRLILSSEEGGRRFPLSGNDLRRD